MTHTELPWSEDWHEDHRNGVEHVLIIGDDGMIAEVFNEDGKQTPDAAFIVKACNSHNDLLEALEGMYNMCTMSPASAPHRVNARAAIAKAKGEHA